MKPTTTPSEIRREYDAGVAYNSSIGLYETVRRNEKFYIGDQWDGLVAPDLDKPVLNFLKRVCSYIVAMLVSDDIALSITPFEKSESADFAARALEREVRRVIESSRAKALTRDMLRNCVVDGDGCFYWYYDPENGGISLELLDNTRVLFGNPYVHEVQRQPYIIIAKRELVDAVKERAARYGGEAELIHADCGAPESDAETGVSESRLVTVIAKLFRRNGRVWFCETTRDAVIRPPADTGLSLYPISYMSYEKVKDSYHGRAVITGLIPNQIAVNKLWAMAIHHQNTLAFPKVFYDRLKIKSWSNRVGEAIGIAGNPADAVTTAFRAPDMSGQLLDIVDRTINYTKEFMGASDATLGNITPDNTSAIIAVQKATAAPLDIQRLALYRFVEDYVRVIIDMICAHYGTRLVTLDGENGTQESRTVDFSAIDSSAMQLNVDVGASAYFSELTQLGTLDSLYTKGVISDAVTYLESLPEGYVRNRDKIIKKLQAAENGQPREEVRVDAV